MDVVGDFLTRIRNAGMARHEKVDVSSSALLKNIVHILQEGGYVRAYKVASVGRKSFMRVYLRYNLKGRHVITKLQRVSRPGLRKYVGYKDIPQVRSGFGLAVLSTNQGVMSGVQAARLKLGGEFLFQLW